VEAARQAARLAHPAATLLLLTVVDPASIEGGWLVEGALEREAAEILDHARRVADDRLRIESRVLEGPIIKTVLEEVERDRAALVVVGSHGHGRLAGVVRGSVATALLHGAPCSVLVARPPRTPARFPTSVVVGFDGSPASETALAVARELSERLEATMRALTAGDSATATARHRGRHPTVTFEEASGEGPVDVLTTCDADLVVVGSRGLRGMAALHSVSEQVAHRADSSVLVVRAGAGRSG
jgi:nucleotide-binding universal stress UspA family protein